jgi:hypothetical protein
MEYLPRKHERRRMSGSSSSNQKMPEMHARVDNWKRADKFAGTVAIAPVTTSF